MALFSSKNKKEESEKQNVSDSSSATKKEGGQVSFVEGDLSGVILRPRITEKASLKMEGNAYVFEILKDADKGKVRRAFKEIYKVEPRKVNIVKTASKRVFIRGKRGVKPGKKKAYIYLKEGDKIEIL